MYITMYSLKYCLDGNISDKARAIKVVNAATLLSTSSLSKNNSSERRCVILSTDTKGIESEFELIPNTNENYSVRYISSSNVFMTLSLIESTDLEKSKRSNTFDLHLEYAISLRSLWDHCCWGCKYGNLQFFVFLFINFLTRNRGLML